MPSKLHAVLSATTGAGWLHIERNGSGRGAAFRAEQARAASEQMKNLKPEQMERMMKMSAKLQEMGVRCCKERGVCHCGP